MSNIINFFEVREKVWIKKLKKTGIILSIDNDNREALIKYFVEENKIEKQTFSLYALEKARKHDEIFFAKLNPEAKIPSKRFEDGAYDIYPCFEKDFIEILPNEIKMIPTGIASSFSPKYRMSLRERGSSGSKGLAKRCGEIDSGYRNEWFVAINNTTKHPIIIIKEGYVETYKSNIAQVQTTYYPYEKAIAQAALEYVPNVKVKEISYDELKNIPSERGLGNLGSSGK